jgi:hypothetical protein
MNMNKEIISFKNSINVNIKTQEAVKNRAAATIRRFKTSEGVTVANKVAMERAEKQLSDAEEKINSYNNSLERISRGDLSELRELLQKSEDLTRENREHESDLAHKKAKSHVASQKQKDATYKKIRKERRAHNWDKKKHKIFYNKYLKAVDTLPDYMKDNLKTMPNNKGYRWRGVAFYGLQKPIKDEPLILFEKRRGVLKICKYFNDREEIYEKKDGTTMLVEKNFKKKVINFPIPPGGSPIEYETQQRNNGGRNRNNGGKNRNNGGRNRNNGGKNRNNGGRNRSNSKPRNLSSWS